MGARRERERGIRGRGVGVRELAERDEGQGPRLIADETPASASRGWWRVKVPP